MSPLRPVISHRRAPGLTRGCSPRTRRYAARLFRRSRRHSPRRRRRMAPWLRPFRPALAIRRSSPTTAAAPVTTLRRPAAEPRSAPTYRETFASRSIVSSIIRAPRPPAADGQDRVDRPTATINAIGTAVPDHDIHAAFIGWARGAHWRPRERALFRADGGAIGHRASLVGAAADRRRRFAGRAGGFYAVDPLPADGGADGALCRRRARRSRWPRSPSSATARARSPISSWRAAPASSRRASTRSSPRALGLPGGVERTLIGFMGCYAAVAALRIAHHIVRSEPGGARAGGDGRAVHAPPPARGPRSSRCSRCSSSATAPPRRSSAPSRAGFATRAPVRRDAARFGRADPLDDRRPGLRDAPVGRGARRGSAQALRRSARFGDALRGRADAAVDALGGPCRRPLDPRCGGGRRSACEPAALAASRAVLARSRQHVVRHADVRARRPARPSRRARTGVALAFGPGLAAEGFRFRRVGMSPLAARSARRRSRWTRPISRPRRSAAVLRDLAQVNRLTLSARPTLASSPARSAGRTRFSLLDVGFGAGRHAARASRAGQRSAGIAAELVGDRPQPEQRARRARRDARRHGDRLSHRRLCRPGRRGLGLIVVSSFVAHHMNDGAARSRSCASWRPRRRRGWMVNDLHRHRFA